MAQPPKLQAAPAVEGLSRSMPFSEQAEKAVLSCMLADPDTLLPEFKATTGPEAFYHSANRLLYETMQEMREQGKPVEYIALSQYLEDAGRIDKIGGHGTLAEILEFIQTPAFYKYYQSIIRDRWTLRRLIGHAVRTIEKCYDTSFADNVPELLRIYGEGTVELVHEIQTGEQTQGATLGSVHDLMIATSGERGISTGFPWMDRNLGGLHKTSLILIGGRRGAGKSSICRQIGWRTARGVPGVPGMTDGIPGVPTDLITVEMSKVQYYQCLCCLEGISSDSVLRQEFSKEEVRIFNRMREMADGIPLRIHDDIKSLEECVARIQLGVMKRNVRVVVVDMPHRLKVTETKFTSRERELSHIFWMLKETAKNLGITVICPIHLNAELGALGAQDAENHADQMLIMAMSTTWEPTLLEPRDKVIFKLIKNRFGPSFKRCLYWFDGPHYHFTEDGETDLDILTKDEAKARKTKKKDK